MAEVGLQFGFCLVLGLGLQGGFHFCLGFPLDVSGVLRHSFLLGVIGGLVLAIEGAVCRGEVGFELPPPSGQGRRFASWLRLLLFGRVPGESATFQLGLGLGGLFPGARGSGGPFLVTGVEGFELLVFGSDLVASACALVAWA